ncbi:hypothetical protein TI39_contig5832g00023 [Zymoseptoria brevis]|uniref:P-loop containing nucleoside triphosphate hydrolase protein n=1 Tax=Zymoseptoria brevis TaxID=1047168 RepID=A0A0F4G5U4_9PEZI|nr:hypothetical protein TI39_contig5832g00023 [Zymoseptoria brevis]
MFTRLTSPLAVSLLASTVAAKCSSFGIDFQGGKTYFQNISSTDPFTFVSTFEGCQEDITNNILYDEAGDEWECTETPTQPDDIKQLSTCPVNKNDLHTGSWGVVIISNNGDAEPIAFDRRFSLVVGEPATTTFTPTVTATVVSTPIVNSTSTSVMTTTSTAIETTTLPAYTRVPTITVRPRPITITKTIGPTISLTNYVHEPLITTVSATKVCRISTQVDPDPTLTWMPSLLPTALLEPLRSLLDTVDEAPDLRLIARDSNSDVSVPLDRAQRIAERKARFAREALQPKKRAPDFSTTTLTETNTLLFFTTTSMSLAPESTVTIPFIVTETEVTTSTSTVYHGKTTMPPTFVTLPTRTVTRWKPTIFRETVATVTRKPWVTITVPGEEDEASCTDQGGRMFQE